MSRKSYCIFSAQFLPHMGGVENYTYNLAKKLVEKGNEVTVIASNVDKVAAYENMEGIRVYRVPCFNMLNGRFPVLKANREFRKIHHIISSQKFDMVIVNTRFYLHSLYGIWIGRRKGIRSIFIEHGTGHLTMHNPCLDFVENIVEHTMTFIEKRMCKEFYGVSSACLEWLKHFHIQGSGVLYNAIDLEKIEYRLETAQGEYRKKHQIPENATVITFTGRLLKEKGIVTLVQAVSHLVEKDDKIYLFIAGDGDEEKFVRQSQTSNIIPLGRITAEEVISLLKESDIFCLPSDSEGMPTSVLEAAACRNYIVTTEKGGAKELIVNENYGKILKNNDLNSVQNALKYAIYHSENRKEATEFTYERLKNHFTWDIVAENVINL